MFQVIWSSVYGHVHESQLIHELNKTITSLHGKWIWCFNVPTHSLVIFLLKYVYKLNFLLDCHKRPLALAQMQGPINAQALFEIENLEATQHGSTNYECPCMCCHGARPQQRNTNKKHLRQNGHNPYFKWSIVVCKFSTFWC